MDASTHISLSLSPRNCRRHNAIDIKRHNLATELFSLLGPQTGWRAQCGVGYSVTAQFDGRFMNCYAETADEVVRMFYRAARRALLRRFIPWVSPPPAKLGWASDAHEAAADPIAADSHTKRTEP
jgi:hypothetical protein